MKTLGLLRAESKALWIAVLITVTLFFAPTFKGLVYADVSLDGLKTLGQSFTQALNNKNANALDALCEQPYWNAIRNRFDGEGPQGLGEFRFLERTAVFVDVGVARFDLLCRDSNNMHCLVVCTVRVHGENLKVSYGPTHRGS